MGSATASTCTSPTAADLVASSPRLSILAAALEADPALKALLNTSTTPVTLFAPTDAAMVDFFDTLGLSRREGLAHPTTAAALRFLVLPGVARRLESFAPRATALTAVGANLTVLSPEAVANLARARAMQEARRAERAAGGNTTASSDPPATANSTFAVFAPLLAPVASALTANGTDRDAMQFLAALAGLAGSLVQAVTPGGARRRIPRMCEDGCRYTVAGPASREVGGVAGDAAVNNGTVLLGNGRGCGPAFVHIIDEVLLPELLGTSGGEGGAGPAVVSVGDGAGGLVSRVVVPGAGGGEVRVEEEAVKAGRGPPTPPPAPAAAPAPAPGPAPALSRRVNPEPVDIINPVVAQVVRKQPAAPPAPPPVAPPAKKAVAPPTPSPTLPAVPEDTLIEAGPAAIPPAGA